MFFLCSASAGCEVECEESAGSFFDQGCKDCLLSGMPTNAIVFGNVHDKESRIFKLRNEEQKKRLYYALDQLHVLPNVNYLVKSGILIVP
jgi:hypothetical protein